MTEQVESMVTRRQFVDLPELAESWQVTLEAMEDRYPVGIILHAPTKARAELLRSAALNAGRDYSYAITTATRAGDGDYLVYIAQL